MAQLLQIAPNSPNVVRAQIVKRWMYAVETKVRWSDPWTRMKYFKPVRATLMAAPGIGRAEIDFRYGMVKREDRNAKAQEYDLELRDQFMRILKISSQGVVPLWTGQIGNQFLRPGGGAKGAGSMAWEAYELSAQLDRSPLNKAKSYIPGMSKNDYVDAWPKANHKALNYGFTLGNRSSAKDADGAYVFSQDAQLWSARDIAEMIVTRYSPVNGPQFTLGGLVSGLDKIYPIIDFHAGDQLKTPWKILTEVITAATGHGFVPVIDNSGNVMLQVFTLTDVDVTIGGTTIPANADKVTLDLDNSIDMRNPQIISSTATKYEQIEVRGPPMLTCFTMSYADGNTEEAFVASPIIQAYKDASKAGAGYAQLDPTSQAKLNDNLRKDEKYSTLWTKHRLKRAWNGNGGSGDGSIQAPALLKCDDNGVVTFATVPFFGYGKQFESWLPFEDGADYSVNPPDKSVQPGNPEPTYWQPFAMVKDPVSSEYYFVHSPSGVDANLNDYDKAAAHLHIMPRELAFKISPNVPHMYGLGQITPDGVTDAIAQDAPIFKYTDILVTIAMRTGMVPKVVLTRQGLDQTVDLVRRKVIEIPNAEYWAVAPGTVLGVNPDGSLKRYAGTGVLRDDTPRLREIAAAAGSWFARDRAAISVQVERIDALAPIGSLVVGVITGALKRNINTVVTSIGYEFGERTNKSTLLQTQYMELDFGGTFNG